MFCEYLNLKKKKHIQQGQLPVFLYRILLMLIFFIKIHWLLLSRNQPNAGVNNPTRLWDYFYYMYFIFQRTITFLVPVAFILGSTARSSTQARVTCLARHARRLSFSASQTSPERRQSIRNRVKYFDENERSLNSPFCRRTGQGWWKLHGFNLVKKYLWKCSIVLSTWLYGQSRCTHFKIIHYCYSDKLGLFQNSEAIIRFWNKSRNQRKQLLGCEKSYAESCGGYFQLLCFFFICFVFCFFFFVTL